MSTEARTKVNSSLQGKLLVASPYIQDSPYCHAVVLVMQHTDHGSCGLLLDNDLQLHLAELEEFARSDGSLGGRIEQPNPTIKLFSGCVVWPAERLEQELEQGIWLTTSAHLNASLLSHDLWTSLLSKIGRSVLEVALHITKFPSDPNLN